MEGNGGGAKLGFRRRRPEEDEGPDRRDPPVRVVVYLRPPLPETLVSRCRRFLSKSGRSFPSPAELLEGKQSPGSPLPFLLWNHRLNRFGKSWIRVRLGFVLPELSFAVAVAVGLRRRLRAPLKGPPVSPLPVATFAFASRRRNRSSAVCPSFAVAAAAPAMLRRHSRRRRRSGRPSSWSPSRRRPRPPLRHRRRPPEHHRRRQAEDHRRFFVVAVAVRWSSAVALVAGEFAVPSATRRCPPFALSCRRSPASMHARAAAGGDVTADVVVVVPHGPVVDRWILAVRFG